MAIPPDPHYIPAYSIEDILLDKDTGAPLTGGIVTFYRDSQRLQLKPVYQITGTSPNYTFIQLPNPMTLSAIGTFQDALENPVIPYFFPYTAALSVDLYYITVESSGGVAQFVRQAQPYIPGGGSGDVTPGTVTNEISNPQFAEVLFDTVAASYTFNFNAVTDEEVEIAPNWLIKVTSPAAGTVTVKQVRPLGTLNLPTNPGTLLQIDSSGITSLQLVQRIVGSPNLWGNGYISGGFMAKTYGGTSKVLSMYYSQSNGVIIDKLIRQATLPGTGEYAYYPGGSDFIDISTSLHDFPDAYIDIFFVIPLSTKVEITSVMVIGTGDTSIRDVGYDEESNYRQIDHLFHYYKPQLAYKPIPSWLVGWDFPLNPAQAKGRGLAATVATGANKAFYAWDQTIVFQTVNSAIQVVEEVHNNGAIVLTTSLACQAALMQYLPVPMCREILEKRFCTNMVAAFTGSSSVSVTITMWYTTNASVPTLPDAFFTGLDANGVPTGVLGGWFQVPRDTLGTPLIPLVNAYTSYQESGWELGDETAALASKFFAIVIGTTAIPITSSLGFQSVSLNSGDIPTIPAPQTPDEVLRECQYYYRKSFLTATPPATGVAAGASSYIQVVAPGVNNYGPQVTFATPMLKAPTVTLYNPVNANAQITTPGGADWALSTAVNVTANGFITQGTSSGAAGQLATVQWTADARLGVV